ncbi:cytochrome P450 [Penicillium verhagenii]|nr:cytochrome P450 [Penicillium verhagenii]
MHNKYGPIVRINPHEVHIIDPDFYDEIYASGSRRRDKDPRQVAMFGAPGSMAATIGHEQHKMRRGLVRGHFSRKAIVNIESLVQEKLDKMIELFQGAHKRLSVVNTSDAFAALTADIIAVYALGIDLDFLDEPDFKNDFQQASVELDMLCHVFKFFPWLAKLAQSIPDSVVRYLQPSADSLLLVQKTIHDQSVASLQKASQGSSETESQGNIFDSLSHTSVPVRERTLSRLQDEGLILLAAGTETTARALAVCAFHLATNKLLMQKLRSELKDVMPSPDSHPTWAQLERLPYLTAVVKESLRLSFGAVGRLSRVAPDETLQYQQYSIPPNTPVSCSSYFIHMNPEIFPEPENFEPERWLRAAERGDKLHRHLVAFSSGSRQCVGMNLAYCQMYLTIAALARQFDMDLHETTVRDVMVGRDYISPFPTDGVGNIKVKFSDVAQD